MNSVSIPEHVMRRITVSGKIAQKEAVRVNEGCG